MELIAGTICTWIDTHFVIGFANSVNLLVGKYAYEPSSGPYKLLIHTMTKTNINKKLLVKIYLFYCSYYILWYLIRTSTMTQLCYCNRGILVVFCLIKWIDMVK